MADNTNTLDLGTQLHATKAEADAAKPIGAPKGMRAFECKKAGTVIGWLNGRGYDHCLSQLAKMDGYSVSTGNARAPITKEQAIAKVLGLSDDEFKSLLVQRKAAKK
jgi:hypothetical protein